VLDHFLFDYLVVAYFFGPPCEYFIVHFQCARNNQQQMIIFIVKKQ